MKNFWDDRYSQPQYVYGENPNVFFKDRLDRLPPGKLLLPAEGEGRNAVYAATRGWDVTAFDQSDEGRKKAEALARKMNVNITYLVMGCHEMSFPVNTFDAIALIFAHFPSAMRTLWYPQLVSYLTPGGHLILESFHITHQAHQERNPKAGGPRDPDFLCTEADLLRDFRDLDVVLIEKTETQLAEGAYHEGAATVVRFVGQKKQNT